MNEPVLMLMITSVSLLSFVYELSIVSVSFSLISYVFSVSVVSGYVFGSSSSGSSSMDGSSSFSDGVSCVAVFPSMSFSVVVFVVILSLFTSMSMLYVPTSVP